MSPESARFVRNSPAKTASPNADRLLVMERLDKHVDADARKQRQILMLQNGVRDMLYGASERLEFVNMYQGKFGLDGTLKSFEALGRVKDNGAEEPGEFISPMLFLPRVKELPQGMRLLTELAVKNVLGDPDLQKASKDPHYKSKVSVNVCPDDLSMYLAKNIESIIKEANSPNGIALELTEDADLKSTPRNHAVLQHLLGKGVVKEFALDDVGSPDGKFGLDVARKIMAEFDWEIGEVKLDRDLLGRPDDLEETLVYFLLKDKTVTVEGVENALHMAMLKDIVERRCPHLGHKIQLQGFALQRPALAQDAAIGTREMERMQAANVG
jgi:EAL domain-containing protein (putative c-di-GMP-specific phosphodiesterase class I)